jgi:hypothetical protein
LCDNDQQAADYDFENVDHDEADDIHHTSGGYFLIGRRTGSWSSIFYDGVR